MADVTFTISTELAQSVQAFVRLIEKQRSSESAFKRQVSEGRRMTDELKRQADASRMLDRGLTRIGTRVMGAAAGYLSFAGAARAVSTALQSIEKAAGKSIELSESIRPLLADDEGLANIPAARQRVLGLSATYGIAAREIAESLDYMSDSTSALDDVTRQGLMRSALQLRDLLGGDLREAVGATAKMYNIWRDSGVSVEQVQSRLYHAVERGAIGMATMSSAFPELSKTARQAGFSLDETVAALIVLNRESGDEAKAASGLRQAMMGLNNAREKGIKLTGDMASQLAQLKVAKPRMFEDLFSDKAEGNAAALIERMDEFNTVMGTLKGLPDGLVEQKVGMRLADTVTAAADSLKRIRQEMEGIGGGGPQAAKVATTQEELELTRVGIKKQWQEAGMVGAMLAESDWLVKMEVLANKALGKLSGNKYLERGAGDVAAGLRAEGKDAEAAAMELRQGLHTAARPGEYIRSEGQITSGATLSDKTRRSAEAGEVVAQKQYADSRFFDIHKPVQTGIPEAELFAWMRTAAQTPGAMPERFQPALRPESAGGAEFVLDEFRKLVLNVPREAKSIDSLTAEIKRMVEARAMVTAGELAEFPKPPSPGEIPAARPTPPSTTAAPMIRKEATTKPWSDADFEQQREMRDRAGWTFSDLPQVEHGAQAAFPKPPPLDAMPMQRPKEADGQWSWSQPPTIEAPAPPVQPTAFDAGQPVVNVSVPAPQSRAAADAPPALDAATFQASQSKLLGLLAQIAKNTDKGAQQERSRQSGL